MVIARLPLGFRDDNYVQKSNWKRLKHEIPKIEGDF